jgi:hypothetical protein
MLETSRGHGLAAAAAACTDTAAMNPGASISEGMVTSVAEPDTVAVRGTLRRSAISPNALPRAHSSAGAAVVGHL